MLASGGAGYESCEATALKYADIVGRIAELDDIIELMTKIEEESNEQSRAREDDAPGLAGPGMGSQW